MNEPLLTAMLEAFAPAIRRMVREEVARAGLEWAWTTPPRAAELLGISEEAVRQRIRRGLLPARKVEGRWYIDVHALDALIGNGRYHGPQLHADQQNGRATASTAPGHDDQGGTP